MCLAIPGLVVSVDQNQGIEHMGTVNFGGVLREVSLACTPDVGVGDYVLVHVGFALEKIDEEEAQEVFKYLKSLGQLEDLESDAMELQE